MKCVTCGAILPAGVDECEHCQTLNDTDFRVLGQASVSSADRSDEETQCPRCQSPLLSLKIQMGDSYQVGRCKRCLGTHFGHSGLARLVNSVASGQGLDQERVAQLCRETPREIWPISYIPCPVCRQTMLRSVYAKTSGVIVDQCKDHGVWLDGGELGRLIGWARAGGPRKGQVAEAGPGDGTSDIVIHSRHPNEQSEPSPRRGIFGALRRVFPWLG